MAKTAVIDVGGGMRGIYTAGVLDTCMDFGIHFDVCIGISAGSGNLAAYLSGQRGRNKKFFTEYAFREEYMSRQNLVRTGNFLNLDYIYSTLSNSDGEDPLDFPALRDNPADFWIEALNAETGEPVFFPKSSLTQDHYDVCKASSCVPGANRPYKMDGVKYYDGGMGDPIPIDKALELGCDKIVLLLTKPKNTVRIPTKDRMVAAEIMPFYPNAAKRLSQRASRYNLGIAWARALERQGKLLIVAPENTEGVDTLKMDKESLERLYARGLRDGMAIRAFLQET